MAKPKKWVRNVKTVSTDPPKDLFTKDAQTIAKTMAKKSVSPKGIDSGIRMIQYFIKPRGQESIYGSKAGTRESEDYSAEKEEAIVLDTVTGVRIQRSCTFLDRFEP